MKDEIVVNHADEAFAEINSVYRNGFQELPTPPSYAEVTFYHEPETGKWWHPLFLWKAKLGHKTFYVYQPSNRPRPNPSQVNHGFRIDDDKKWTTTHPHQAHFELALWKSVDSHMDALITKEGA